MSKSPRFVLEIDLRHPLFEKNRTKNIAALLREAADRLDQKGYDFGGFNNALGVAGIDGGYMVRSVEQPMPMRETNALIQACALGDFNPDDLAAFREKYGVVYTTDDQLRSEGAGWTEAARQVTEKLANTTEPT